MKHKHYPTVGASVSRVPFFKSQRFCRFLFYDNPRNMRELTEKFSITNIQAGLYDLIVGSVDGQGIENILIKPDSIAVIDDYTRDGQSWIMTYK